MGGSLRNPASFNGIVGFRPSIGRVAHTPRGAVQMNLGQQGPMARNVEDCALLLDAMCGEDPRDPFSLPRTGESYLAAARSGWRPKRVAWSADLGVTRVDNEVAAITRKGAERFAELGASVEEAHPDLSGLHECFITLRTYDFYMRKAVLLREHRELLKPEVIWNIEKGFKIDLNEMERAENMRVALAQRYLAFFDRYDLLLTPATAVAAYPIEDRYVAEVNGHKFSNYVEWLAIAYAITVSCGTALSLPCGFTRENLPVGLQIAGPPRSEARILSVAKQMEDILGLRGTTPIEPRVTH
jgi:amidase